MRAAYDPIRHHDRFGCMIQYELEDAGCNGTICPNVALFGEPTFQCGRLGIPLKNNPNRGFGRAFVVRTVERDGRRRVAAKAAPGFLLQR
jgi:hypothetical protein